MNDATYILLLFAALHAWLAWDWWPVWRRWARRRKSRARGFEME